MSVNDLSVENPQKHAGIKQIYLTYWEIFSYFGTKTGVWKNDTQDFLGFYQSVFFIMAFRALHRYFHHNKQQL